MLDGRIYRTAWIVVAVAAIVVAFSLKDQQGAIGTTLPPAAFNGQNAYLDMVGLDRKYPDRRPGSAGDNALAVKVATAMRRDGFTVSTTTNAVRTADGTKTIKTVVGTRLGLTSGGSVVVVSHRDSPGPANAPANATDLSGTAVMLELARVLSGQTQHRPVVLVSTSGSAGLAGATEVARGLGTGVDAVIALGDLASDGLRQPVIVPFSSAQQLAPTALRNTLGAALAAQAQINTRSPSFLDQFAHLAFPLSLTEQAPFAARGYPAAAISLAGERAGAAGTKADPTRITGVGQAVLQSVNSLDGGPQIQAPSAYLILSGKVIPAWAVKLMVLALIVPVLLTAIDGLARARRRHYAILRPLGWVLGAAVPFVLAALLIVAARLTGLLGATPPGPLGANVVRLGTAGIVVLALVAAVLIAGFYIRRRWLAAHQAPDPGTGIAVLLVLCAAALVIAIRNPFAAALTIPALHLWMWVLDPTVRMPRSLGALLTAIGLMPPVLVIGDYMRTLGLSPLDALWNGSLLVAGGYIGLVAILQWSVLLGCSTSMISIAVRRPRLRHQRPEETPVTVRGPITYAGPGSLGGTESALRR